MKSNVIQFPMSRQRTMRVKSAMQSDELKTLRAAFDQARTNWPLEMAELPENNKMYSRAKKY